MYCEICKNFHKLSLFTFIKINRINVYKRRMLQADKVQDVRYNHNTEHIEER